MLFKMKKNAKEMPPEIPPEKERREIEPLIDPEEPLNPPEGPDLIPEEDPFENLPYEMPPPGEGP